jgi:hypothetical protein
MTFNGDSVEASRIKEDADYEGVRVRFDAELAGARIRMQIDLGFGDTILPARKRLWYPTILDFPAPVLLAYPRESVVAEKLEALTVLGLINSRLKDYFDLWLLSKLYLFDGPVLAAAVEATFQRRDTTIQAVPVGLTETFGRDHFRAVQWRALRRQSAFATAPVVRSCSISFGLCVAITLRACATARIPRPLEFWRPLALSRMVRITLVSALSRLGFARPIGAETGVSSGRVCQWA